MTTRLESGIVCRDAAPLLHFYESALGFVPATKLEFNEGTVHKLRRDDAWLKIFAPATTPQAPAATAVWSSVSGFRYAALNLSTADQVAESAALVAQHGGTVLSEPQTHRANASFALVTDPEGNVWELLWDGNAV